MEHDRSFVNTVIVFLSGAVFALSIFAATVGIGLYRVIVSSDVRVIKTVDNG